MASLSLTATARAAFTDLAGLCAAAVRARLERPAPADGDWSLTATAGCGCELCATLGMFLSDSRQQTLEWPLAEQRRRHVHARIDEDELPVGHQTRRSGRPYTLVLTKDAGLFAREALARQRDHATLDWLVGTWGAAL